MTIDAMTAPAIQERDAQLHRWVKLPSAANVDEIAQMATELLTSRKLFQVLAADLGAKPETEVYVQAIADILGVPEAVRT